MRNTKKVRTGNNHKSSPFRPKIIVIDDDSIVTGVMRHHLKSNFPEAIIDISNAPVIRPGYDIYFLDNDFGGMALAKRLLQQVREVSPHALVVALSNTLDLDVMRDLVNAGCNIVYDKRYPGEATEARQVIRNYLTILEDKYNRLNRPKLVDLANSIKRLLGEWNTRLNGEIAK